MRGRPTSRFSFDRSALLYVIVTLLLGVGSLHSQNNLLFIAFGVAIGVLLVNGSYAWASLSRVGVTRSAPARGVAGSPLTLRYAVRSGSRVFPAAALLIREPSLPGAAAAVSTVSRKVPARAAMTWTPGRRGELLLGPIDISTRFPFGAVKKTVRFTQPARVLIRPEPRTPAAGAFRSAVTSVGVSAMSTGRAGAGEEFLGLREYVPGDPIRKIAWRASARHRRWVIREFSTPEVASLRLSLVTDPALDDDANEAAVSLAAGALSVARRHGVRLFLCDPAGGGRVIRGLPEALDALALVDTARPPVVPRRPADVRVLARPAGPVMVPRTRAAVGARA